MTYTFENLPQLVDMRGKLASKGSYADRRTPLSQCTRAWHHSLTRKHLGGSDAASFAKYHVETLGWPGVGYHLVIEPKNIIQTPKGPRARIVYANDVNKRTYNVGDSNDHAVGICVAGDYRYEDLVEATKATIDELQEALEKDRIGKADKSHHEFPGYSWKACCVFDYKATFKFLDHKAPVTAVPDTYKIQEGDTLWNIANNEEGITVADLLAANPGIDPSKLKIGQVINLGKAKGADKPAPVTPATPTINSPAVKIGQTITLKSSASKYATGQTIPKNVTGKKYTVMQVATGRVLLKEILSWVFTSDVTTASPKPASSLAGKRVEAIVGSVNFYNTPRWANPSGQFTRGQGWTIIEQITTEGSLQLKVKNSRGQIYYVTARKDLVKII
ncbi:LysM peptidoglycan-binding domain-containing protein [Jeotgalibacillus soli]|uniref:LysM domain-containing protein n=1 Tax=Jeotgalibacillus soli TaxID=889306 RepID=A0A0C2RVI2_9BACL|nr:LysM peptidoglycan-binding domain-containing protein [Jeotgalibacillus soli]KIL45774.1 hypothetical protein KP78_21230 [Jeotgalibacillus soli]